MELPKINNVFSSVYLPSTFWLFSVICVNTPLQQHLTSLLGEDQESRNSWYEHREMLKESKGDEVMFEN